MKNAVISDRIRANFAGMRDGVIWMLTGENVPVNPGRYMNTMTDFRNRDDAFTYLIHTGYLAYNLEDSTYRIPNKEIRQEWYYAAEGILLRPVPEPVHGKGDLKRNDCRFFSPAGAFLTDVIEAVKGRGRSPKTGQDA